MRKSHERGQGNSVALNWNRKSPRMGNAGQVASGTRRTGGPRRLDPPYEWPGLLAASHRASLSLPTVKDAITKGKPLIARFEQATATQPVGGHGLPRE